MGPDSYEALVALLHERLPDLSRSHRLLADRVLADPEGIAFMTIGDLAGAVDVNESTVVRFATGLGLKGYPGLTRLCRDKLSEEAQLLRRFTNAEQQRHAGDDPLEQAAAFDQANVARTLARIDPDTWSATVEALAGAPRVHVLGLRKVHSVAFLLSYLLGMVRDDVELLSPATGTLVEGLRRVRPGDCFVAVSIHRYIRETVQGFRWARDAGATTIALTDNAGSPLVPDADHTFYVDTAGVAVLRSLTGFVTLVQALANGVAAERGDAARATLGVEESLLDEFGVYE
ncbi:MAG TPA: MurR/RpiR family transcriptional regulator [Acidimicrobiales bacterium]|nr:MurR/RpiR family transcriptional regulator [Acidimicrobiales bacterium]